METSLYLPIVMIVGGIIFLILFFHYVPFSLWLSAKVSGVNISFIQLFLMRIRNVQPYIILPGMIEAHKAGLNNITRDELEAHYLAAVSYTHLLPACNRFSLFLSIAHSDDYRYTVIPVSYTHLDVYKRQK